jgi:hypothetical protein
MLQGLDARQDFPQLRRVIGKFDAQFPRLHHDVAAPGQIADEHVARVADRGRINVLVAADDFLHRVDVRAALVRKRRRTDPRLARVVAQVGDFIHELRKVLEQRQRRRRHAAFAQFEKDVGNDAGQVAIAGALAVTIDRALHVRRARLQRRQRIGHAQAGVIMRVNAQPHPQFARAAR